MEGGREADLRGELRRGLPRRREDGRWEVEDDLGHGDLPQPLVGHSSERAPLYIRQSSAFYRPPHLEAQVGVVAGALEVAEDLAGEGGGGGLRLGGVLEEVEGAQGVAVEVAGVEGRNQLAGQAPDRGRVAALEVEDGELQADHRQLVAELAPRRLGPHLLEGGARGVEVAEAGVDLPLEPAAAQPARRLGTEALVEGEGLPEAGEGLERLAALDQPVGEVVVGLERQAALARANEIFVASERRSTASSTDPEWPAAELSFKSTRPTFSGSCHAS